MKMILGFYSQQLEGANRESVERVVNSALKSLLQKLYNNKSLKINLHISGFLMEWIEINQPEINTLINTLVRKGQLELLSSSFYGSTLSLLPRSERSSHIEKTTTFIRKRYSKRPKGCWFYNQIWDSSYISTMNICGLEYAVMSINPKNLSIKNEPFLMTKLGATNCIIPSNYDFALMMKNAFDEKENTEKYIEKINQIKISKSSYMDFVMVNLDQIIYEGLDTVSIIDAIFNKYISQNYIPSSIESSGIMNKKEIKRGYLVPGIYGCDINSEYTCPEEFVNKDKYLARLNGRLFALRLVIKNFVSDKYLKKELRNSLAKCVLPPTIFQKEYFQTYLWNLERKIGEIEHILVLNNCCFPLEMDIDFDMKKEYFLYGKSINAILDQKGGTVCSLFYNTQKRNFQGNSEQSLFSDKFLINNKKINLSKAIYAVDIKDKRHSEFEFSFQYVKNKINFIVIKNYKFRSNTLNLSIKIKNLGNDTIKGNYNLMVPLSCFHFDNKKSEDYIEEEYKSFYFRRKDDFSSTLFTLLSQNDPFSLWYKDFFVEVETPYSHKEDYRYTDLNLKWDIDIKAGAELSQGLIIKFEKNKEKRI